MKRDHEDVDDPFLKKYRKHDVETSSMSSASPAWSATSASPHHRSKNQRTFHGCSKISEYEFLDKLGEGTFGEVHKARNKRTGEYVALKRILMHNEKEGIPITAMREIKILKQLRNKNIVPLVDIAVDRAGLLDNPSVRLSQPQIKAYLKQLLEGTAYLHHNKILHRDMKAANLLIDNEGVLQIADFGLARGIEGENKEYTNCVVTRWYRPPELLLGERKYTTAIDVWGVGCVFGELLKSRPILQGQDDIDQLVRIFNLCGSPSEENMPNWHQLPDAAKVKFENSERRIIEEYTKFDPLAADLLDKLLVLDPTKRLTALEALEHDYFYSTPLPAKPSEMPKYESSHEFDRRKKAQKQQPR
ncbi:hypothetical protein G6F56_000329 [Rhizopus delemar]|nr:hypothetical protein G6F56_000329 [Rhizopus delemar]